MLNSFEKGENVHKRPDTADDLYEIIRISFSEANMVAKRWSRRHRLRQIKGVHDLVREIQNLVILLEPRPDGFNQKRRFWQALDINIRHELIRRGIDISTEMSFHDLNNAADRVYSTLRSVSDRGGNNMAGNHRNQHNNRSGGHLNAPYRSNSRESSINRGYTGQKPSRGDNPAWSA